jgi:hypothetical protein
VPRLTPWGCAMRCWPSGRGRVIAALVLLPLVVGGCSKSNDKSSASATSNALATTKVSVQNFKYSGMPNTLPSGLRAIDFTNKETFPIVHEMVVMSLGGKQAADMVAAAKKSGTKSEDDWLHFGEVVDVGTGATQVTLFNLPPGKYTIACYETGTPQGKENGPPHLTIGMIHPFTVT